MHNLSHDRVDIMVVYSLYHTRVVVVVVENLHRAVEEVAGERDSGVETIVPFLYYSNT